MRRLVFVTQAVDPGHPVLAATLAKIRALADRVDEVVVLADRVVEGALPRNCRVHSFGAPSRIARGTRYLAALAPQLANRPLAVVAHMAPVFAVLAAPMVRPLRVPLLLWFTQQGSGRLLMVAERAVDAIVTVDARTVPLESRKVRAIGHGIDVTAFPCRPRDDKQLRALVGLGRYAPVKDWKTVLRALSALPEATLTLHGPMLTISDRAHRSELERLAAELGVGERAIFRDEIPYDRIPKLFAHSDAVVNATLGNAADKVVYEAAASCVPVFAASPVFDTLLPQGLRFKAGDPTSLTDRIRGYDGRAAASLRAKVEADHSVEHWADSVLEVVAR
jgi:glycosyltransferase involved in cell wall biosynthesis